VRLTVKSAFFFVPDKTGGMYVWTKYFDEIILLAEEYLSEPIKKSIHSFYLDF
jgi:hypothetical protein